MGDLVIGLFAIYQRASTAHWRSDEDLITAKIEAAKSL